PQADLAGARAHLAGNEMEQRRFPGPIGPDDGMPLVPAHVQAHAPDDVHRAEGFADIVHGKDWSIHVSLLSVIAPAAGARSAGAASRRRPTAAAAIFQKGQPSTASVAGTSQVVTPRGGHSRPNRETAGHSQAPAAWARLR